MVDFGKILAARRLGFLARGKWLIRFYFYVLVKQVIGPE